MGKRRTTSCWPWRRKSKKPDQQLQTNVVQAIVQKLVPRSATLIPQDDSIPAFLLLAPRRPESSPQNATYTLPGCVDNNASAFAYPPVIPKSPSIASLWSSISSVTDDSSSSSRQSGLIGAPSQYFIDMIFANAVQRKYRIMEHLGQGAYSLVYKAVEKATGTEVAIKKIGGAFKNADLARMCYRELFYLKHLNHKNIISVSNILIGKEDMYMALELMGTTLDRVWCALADQQQRSITYQLLDAIHFIHSGGIIHRDIKPKNILINTINTISSIKLCDFGLARSLQNITNPNSREQRLLTAAMGTMRYQSPELLLGSQRYTTACDTWAAGCVLGGMLRGKTLFSGTDHLDQLECILKAMPVPTADEISSLRCTSAELITLEIAYQIPKAVDLTDILPKGVSADAVDLLKGLLAFSQDTRVKAEQALGHPYLARYHGKVCVPKLPRYVVPPLLDTELYASSAYKKEIEKISCDDTDGWDATRKPPTCHLTSAP